ncbi:voltage-gated purine nucleotide uniporter SLC17A9 isoform X1 [Hydra vulgaris]|uniref:voltage-gated purine nucleotide uniporter SLC17A9 isoform X1 n=1 Tax=Hydra vulgaris TaxID=6087 RepID=UPI0001926520|nr:solute carrier family 17 member 9-like [Hydra vulgaris]
MHSEEEAELIESNVLSDLNSSRDNFTSLSAYSKKKLLWNGWQKIGWTSALFLGCLLVYCVRTSMSICISALSDELHWDKKTEGFVLTSYFAGYLLTNIIGGYLADFKGGERVIFYSTFVWSFFTILIPALVNSVVKFGFKTVIVCRFIIGLSQGMFFPSLSAILAKSVSIEDRSFIFSCTFSGSSIGTVITGLFGTILLEQVHWSSVFYFFGIASFLWAFLLKCLHWSKKKNPLDTDNIRGIKKIVPIKVLLFNKSVLAMLFAYFSMSVSFYVFLSWSPTYFHETYPKGKAWLFNVLPYLASFLLSLGSGKVANMLIVCGFSVTFVRKLFGSLLFLGMCFFSLLLAATHSFETTLFVMTLNIGMNAFAASSVAINPQDLSPEQAGVLYGVANTCGALGGFLGVLISGIILSNSGEWFRVFIMTSVISFLGFLVYIMYGSGKKVKPQF